WRSPTAVRLGVIVMTRAARLRTRFALLVLGAASTIAATPLVSADPEQGYRPVAYAIQGAKIGVTPEQSIEAGTVVVREGRIEAVGPADKVQVPFDAEVIDGKGLFVYPGLIDLYTTIGQSPGVPRSKTGSGRSVDF